MEFLRINLFRALTYLSDYYQESFDRIHKAQSIAESYNEFFCAFKIFCTAKYSETMILVTYSECKNDIAVWQPTSKMYKNLVSTSLFFLVINPFFLLPIYFLLLLLFCLSFHTFFPFPFFNYSSTFFFTFSLHLFL